MDTPALFDRAFVAPATYDAFFAVVRRLEGTLVDEADAVKQGRHEALAAITRQKRQGFLELNRIMRGMDGTIPSQDIIARLAAFRKALDANSELLTTHLNAAREVTSTILRVMHESESDGTYSRSLGYPLHDVA